ncbi:endonuclease MutS2 [Megalodesulfovibrio paquesii]
MNGRAATLLELPKLLERLSHFAASEAGKAACLAIAPLPDAQAVARAAALHDEMREFAPQAAQSGARPADFPPLDGLFAYLDSGRGGAEALDLDALASLRDVLQQARQLLNAVDAGGTRCPWPLLAEDAAALDWPAKTFAALTRCLNAEGLLKDEASPELFSVRVELRKLHQQCTLRAKEFILEHKLSPWLQDDYITISSDRYVLPLKTSFKNRLPGIIHDYSQTGETCYFEPMFLVERNNAVQELKREEREAERQVMRFLTGLVRDELEACKATTAFLIQMDVRHAVLELASRLEAATMETGPGLPLALRQVRHPLLVLDEAAPVAKPAPALGKGGKARAPRSSVVPLDIVLEKEQRILVISGGNAGGKTVCLKTLGLAALMARCGLPVPAAAGSTMPWFEEIFVFLGDEQSLEDHVSTFTAQITRLRDIWDEIDAESLVLLDEFGAGTDPAQGSALAQGVLEELVARGAWGAAATHFPALKAFALAAEGVRAASVLFDPETKKPLYRLGLDQVGASQALDVAREHGLPEAILKRAEQHLLLDGEDAQSLIERLNELAVERARELDTLRRDRKELRDKERQQREKLVREQEALFAELKKQSQAIMRQWQEGKIAHKQAMRELAETRKQIVRAEAAPAAVRTTDESQQSLTAADLEKGQRVRYLPWNKVGVVEDVDPKRGAVKLEISGVSLWVAPAELRLAEGAPATASKAPVVAGAKPAATAPAARQPASATPKAEAIGSLRLDLRGRRAEEALRELEEGVDQAMLRNYSQLEIVHGRGTGALRREVHAWLRQSPAVAEFAMANEDQGGDGVTMAVLK